MFRITFKNETTEYGEKGKITNIVSQAFMSAISDENKSALVEHQVSLNHFKLDLGISTFARNMLNGIWDYYANKG